MSRNLQQSHPVTPTKTPSKTSSENTYFSSDEDYAGVEEISDSEGEEPDVQLAEEQAIIDEEGDELLDTPRPLKAAIYEHEEEDEEEDEDVELDENGQVNWDALGEGSDADWNEQFNDHMERTSTSSTADQYPDHELFHLMGGELGGRRVHFSLDDSSDEENSVDDYFPDLFIDRDNVDPGFLKMIDQESVAGDNESEDGSFWDFKDAYDNEPRLEGFEPPVGDDSPSKGSDDTKEGSLSGYDSDTDEGSTTEEDDFPGATIVDPQQVQNDPDPDSMDKVQDEDEFPLAKSLPKPNPASFDADSSDEEEIPRPKPRRPAQRRGPRLGQWLSSSNTNYALLDKKTKRLVMFRVKPRNAFIIDDLGFPPLFSGLNPLMQSSHTPVMKNDTDVLMPSMQSSMNSDGQIIGPPEAFGSFYSLNPDSTISCDDVTDGSGEPDDDYHLGELDSLVDLDAFLDMGEEPSDENVEQSVGTTAGKPFENASSRATMLRSEDQVHHLLSNRSGLVGAFRQNQTRHALLARQDATQDSLSFYNPHGLGPIRGIKQGKLANANNPITPVRRKRKSQQVGLESSPLSRLTAGGLREERKRKMESAEASRGHKRTKSLA